jgi:DNA-binding transcriptional regulator LsrR (DeoR family)
MAIHNDNTHQQLRLATQIARLYHEQNRTQPEIAQLLSITQTRVSRMLKFASENGIIRTTVHVPPGIFSDIEDELQRKFGGIEFIVVDAAHLADENVLRALGSSTAAYLERVVPSCEIIGVSSWSETLLNAVEMMRPLSKGATTHIVQVFGGFGRANSQVYATRLTERLAQISNAEAMFLLAPGVVSSTQMHEMLMNDVSCQHVLEYCGKLSMILMGIGCLTPSRLLQDSGNVLDARTWKNCANAARSATSACASTTATASSSTRTSMNASSASAPIRSSPRRAASPSPAANASSSRSAPPCAASGSPR